MKKIKTYFVSLSDKMRLKKLYLRDPYQNPMNFGVW